MRVQRKNCHSKHIINTIVFAFLLIIAGTAFLGFNLGYIPMPYKNVIFSWPMLIIAWGILSISKSHFWNGSILLIAGAFFIIPNIANACPGLLNIDSANFTHLYWPLLLIAAGLLFLIHRLIPGSHKYHHEKYFEYTKYKDTEEAKMNRKQWKEGKGYFNKQSVFSSGKHIVLDPEFKGGEINTVLGDTTLDLRKTNLPEGDTFLEINTVLGSITIFVPTDWEVKISMEAVIYNFEDKRFDSGEKDKTRRLVIIGNGVLGSGELRN
ncbi:LiaF domain-containing protein [uncultured Bacteroides sp.]|uniref:LiaF domain-containing protein n=1 Tax=uncultured Bacteroides sp. TaxID=162156 RepID=UPI002AAAB283|nr:LiaF domain-containing protein [uncultured Bacteroides sp.]